jgi:hypothetical protein
MPSSKKRPSKLPDVSYPAGSLLRKISTVGDVRWRGYRILGGRGLVGQLVRVAESDQNVEIFFGEKSIRKIPLESLARDRML